MRVSIGSATRNDAALAIVFYLVLALTLLLYWPGLHGAFILDDRINLLALSDLQEPITLRQLIDYSFSGMAGGMGRPLAMASFSLQYPAWPSDPGAFKYANLLLHLLNGGLLFWLLLSSGRLLGWPATRISVISLLTAAVWLLHPLQVSTVLYVVQRMTELSALFSLAGLLAYVRGRRLARDGATVRGYAWMSLGIVAGGLLATLSKENGLLLPLYVLALELTLFAALPRPMHWRLWQGIFLYSPLLLVAAVIAVNFDALILKTYLAREFTLGERLLTEARILLDYLAKIGFPFGRSFSLFHDDFPVSSGLLRPPATLAALMAISMLVGTALYWRKRFPVYAFGVLWFFFGHTLESTLIPLELYYEHRNYLPSMGILLAAIYFAHYLYGQLSKNASTALLAGAVLVFSGTLFVTRQETVLWGDPLKQAHIWSTEKPLSRRAQERAGVIWAMAGEGERAAAIFSRMADIDPGDARGYGYLLHLSCHYPNTPLPEQGHILESLRNSRYSTGLLSALDEIVTLKGEGGCKRLNNAELLNFMETLLDNPHFSPRRANLYFMLGRLHAVEGRIPQAVAMLDRAFSLSPSVDTLLQQTAWLAGTGHFKEARTYLLRAKELSAFETPIKQRLHQAEIAARESRLASMTPSRR